MRTKLSLLLSLFFVLASAWQLRAQDLEFGVKGGIMLYSGDLSPQEVGLYFDDVNTAGGVYLRYRPTNRFGLRVNGDFGRISAERESTAPNEFGESVLISRNFRSSISEFNLVGEYDLVQIGDPQSNYLAFYAYAGLGVTSFNPEGDLGDGVFRELQPLRTEGQGLRDLNPEYDAAPYNLTEVALILGGGIRVRFSERFVIGLELGGRKLGTDYLDDISDTQVSYLDVLSQPNNGGIAARYSNPAVQDASEVTDLRYRRGGDAEDYYYVGSLTVGITIGDGGGRGRGRGKTGCYQF